MERAADLVSLSRDHHLVLELALRLRRADAGGADEVRLDVLEMWERDLREHLHVEEELVLPAFARRVDADDPDIVRTLVEHVEIRRRVRDIPHEGHIDVAELRALGELLHDHVRHEERTLFPRIEDALSVAEIGALGDQLRAAARRVGRDERVPPVRDHAQTV